MGTTGKVAAVVVALGVCVAAVQYVRAPDVYVECALAMGTVTCSVTHRSGAGATACWEFVADCANGSTVRVPDCAFVAENGKVGKSSRADVSGCDSVAVARVTSLTVTP